MKTTKSPFTMIVAIVSLIIVSRSPARSQPTADPNCGVNSAAALSRLFDSTGTSREQLGAAYPSSMVSLLDVKKMCEEAGTKVRGVKATLQELLDEREPCIIALRAPNHFTVVCDGDEKHIRIFDDNELMPRVLARQVVESRFTGYALISDIAIPADAPQLQLRHTDEYQTFAGIGQKAEFHFPLQNMGKSPLQVQLSGTSCGCTAAVLRGTNSKNLTLAQGAQSEVVVSYQVQTQAPIQQMATLKTNDPRHPVIYLTIRGQLPPQLTLSPPALYVDQNLGEEPDKMFKVIGPKSTRVEKVWSDLPYLQLRTGEREVDGERVKWPISVQGFAQAPVGPISGKVFVKLASGEQIFVQVRGLIEGQPPGVAQAALLPRAEDDHQTPIGSPLPTLKVDQAAPNFSVQDANARVWRLSDLRGQKNVLLTFFPKCFTGGCATQLSSLRDHQADFDTTQTQVLAVSVDPAEGNKGQLAFAKQWGFQFPLIPDTKRILGKQFGAIQNDDERAARLSFLIDKQGIVRWIDTDVHVETHGADVLAKIKELGLDR